MKKINKKEICHVCKKEKETYIVFLDKDPFSYINYVMAREKGAICKRCDQYFAMTGEFKDATDKEFEIAKQSCKFARNMLKWWKKDKKMTGDINDSNVRQWEGTVPIAKWFRDNINDLEL
jgi:hypothetical protein